MNPTSPIFETVATIARAHADSVQPARVERMKFPATGHEQVACGTVNGEWACWFIHNGEPGKLWRASSRQDALEMYDDFRDVLRHQLKTGQAPTML